MTTIELLERTKAAWGSIRSASAEEKDRLLLAMAESLEANSEDILRENHVVFTRIIRGTEWLSESLIVFCQNFQPFYY